MQDLFLKLTHNDWVNCFTKLNKAELGVLFYIRTLDPFGNRPIELNSTVVAEVLGIDRSTVSKALKKLNAEGYIDLEILTARVSSKTSKTESMPVGVESQDVPVGTPVGVESQDVPVGTIEPPEPSPNKGYKPSKINKTYKDFKDSLSESEREKFMEFGRKKAASLPHPPQLPDKWIAANFTELYEQFQQTTEGQKTKVEKETVEWESHPQLEEWLHKANSEGGVWAMEDPTQKEERLAFMRWAMETNAYARVGL